MDTDKSNTILIVEDEEEILTLTREILTRYGYNVLTACNPKFAISLAKKYMYDIHLILSDIIMPEMNGKEMIDHILSFAPKMKYIFMSGYSSDVISQKGIITDDRHFIQKPFKIKTLIEKIFKILNN